MTYSVTKYGTAKMIVRGNECVGYDLSDETQAPRVVGEFPTWDDAVRFVKGHGGRHSVNFDRTDIFEAGDGWHYDITLASAARGAGSGGKE